MKWHASFAEITALIHLAHTELCVRIHEHDIERARRGLDKALQAREVALGRVRTFELRDAQELPMLAMLRRNPACASSGS